MSFPGVQYTHEDFPKLQVLASVVSYNYLHPEIREKGGAYGAGLRAGESLSFYSYRDPNLESTLESFNGSSSWIKNSSSFTQNDIDEAKISMFGSMDSPVVPSRKGLSMYNQGITNEMRQQVRDGVFATTREDLVQVMEKYIDNQTPAITVIGNAEKIPEGWTVQPL